MRALQACMGRMHVGSSVSAVEVHHVRIVASNRWLQGTSCMKLQLDFGISRNASSPHEWQCTGCVLFLRGLPAWWFRSCAVACDLLPIACKVCSPCVLLLTYGL